MPAPSNILAIGAAADVASADFAIAVGEEPTVLLKGAGTRPATVTIEMKDDEGGYTIVGDLQNSSPKTRSAVLRAAATYRFVRRAGTCGVSRGG